ncbi:MAG: hypothetical protein ACRYE8_02575, partial [Janthinobacterium lividum]
RYNANTKISSRSLTLYSLLRLKMGGLPHDGPMHVENSNVMLHYPTIGKIDGTNNKKLGK